MGVQGALGGGDGGGGYGKGSVGGCGKGPVGGCSKGPVGGRGKGSVGGRGKGPVGGCGGSIGAAMLAISASTRILYSVAIVVLLFKGKPNAERVFEKKKK